MEDSYEHTFFHLSKKILINVQLIIIPLHLFTINLALLSFKPRGRNYASLYCAKGNFFRN